MEKIIRLLFLIFLLVPAVCFGWGSNSPEKMVVASNGTSYTYVYSGSTTSTGSASQDGDYSTGSSWGYSTTTETIAVIGVYIDAVNTATACKCALYNASTFALLAQSTFTPSTGWVDCDITDTTPGGAVSFDVQFQCDGDGDIDIGTDGTSDGGYTSGTYANFPADPGTISGYSSYMTRYGY